MSDYVADRLLLKEIMSYRSFIPPELWGIVKVVDDPHQHSTVDGLLIKTGVLHTPSGFMVYSINTATALAMVIQTLYAPLSVLLEGIGSDTLVSLTEWRFKHG